MSEITIKNLNELDDFAKELANYILHNGYKTVLFYGEMGAGKTTLIKQVCKHLGITDNITSPTFAIVNEYKNNRIKIYHFDFYRISSIKEVFDIGFEEYLDSDDYCFIEWPEIIEDYVYKNSLKLNIIVNSQSSRIIKF
ncbi:MAG: tRNA (adenosine(37)-N6)-threonylcarbamoyltransferase complex ATPase subunit type 1 TsaE [Bacteroidales bacterium]|jgi:tRNA threonylcarbamoyladenosine biosynthesis protein TsaE|nr:tRNA (adenosine(37)-N6)-threonylcarbamoyltransferase complex ATPase subunit type 1 TsaE [Bacteroidales bacterium]HOL98968.1 tRNA (adenosine(37)-N6)-threonylcarbamoyltransferase complex ATPase subunit type 1 TsaE [Bacteroidales bacterium]HOM37292.1 tRNA (adenosine(37)-N6)-threonylcarbamoyltransferase complex ATPase subunit type 1 TsaE [Bacteroidales bacterium]HPD24849.1 tRNA (adenosine(37)-N6)-threonylcarbamoyltransferase complex ATPase subunit type 1 TsaE [Bacteroidales bacterium]HRT00562.1 